MNFSCHAIHQFNLIFRSAFRLMHLCEKSARLTFPFTSVSPLSLTRTKFIFLRTLTVLRMRFLLHALTMLRSLFSLFFLFLLSALHMYRQCYADVFENADTTRRGERTRLGKYNDEPLCREQRVLMNEFFLPNHPFYFPSQEIKHGAYSYSKVANVM